MCTIPIINMTKTGQHIVVLHKRAGLSVWDLQNRDGFDIDYLICIYDNGFIEVSDYDFSVEIFEVGIAKWRIHDAEERKGYDICT